MIRPLLCALLCALQAGCTLVPAIAPLDAGPSSSSSPPPPSASGDATLQFRCAAGVESMVSVTAEIRTQEASGERANARIDRVYRSEVVTLERGFPAREYRRYWVAHNTGASHAFLPDLDGTVHEVAFGGDLLPPPDLRSGCAENLAVPDLLSRLLPNRDVASGQRWIATVPPLSRGTWRVAPEVTLAALDDEWPHVHALLVAQWEADLPPMRTESRATRESSHAFVRFNVLSGRIIDASVTRTWTPVPADGSAIQSEALLTVFEIDRREGRSLSDEIADGIFTLIPVAEALPARMAALASGARGAGNR